MRNGAEQYPEVLAIAQACGHVRPHGDHMIADGRGGWLPVCRACSNLAHAAYKRARKAELDARPKDCVRCGERPHTFVYGGWKLCGRCLTATKREHYRSVAKAGALAIFATSPMVDTREWAGRKEN